MQPIWHAVSPIKQYGDKLVLFINAYKRGHDRLVYYNIKNPQEKTELKINKPEMTLTGIVNNTEYALYTESDRERSLRTLAYCSGETKDEMIGELEKSIASPNRYHQEALVELRGCLDNKPDEIPARILAELYGNLNTFEDEKLKAYFDLVIASQNIENQKSNFLNTSNEARLQIIHGARPILKVSPTIDKVQVFTAVKDQMQYHSSINLSVQKEEALILGDNSFNYLFAYCKGNLVGRYVHFSGDDKSRNWQWEVSLKQQAQMDELLSRPLYVPPSFDFTEKELALLLKESMLTPYEVLLPRPIISFDAGKFSITVEQAEILSAMKNDFYITAKDSDLLFSDLQGFRQKITRKENIFETKKHFISRSGEYFFFVEDAKGNIISQLAGLYLDTEDTFTEKNRQYEIYQYKKRLMPIVEAKAKAFYSLIAELVDMTMNATEVSSLTAYKYIIESINSYKYQQGLNKIVETLLEVRTTGTLYSPSFFLDGVRYYEANNTIVFPPKNDRYILQAESFSMGGKVNCEYIASSTGAVEYRIWPNNYYVFQAIDNETYCRSGHIFIDYCKKNPGLSPWNIEIEVL